MSNKIKIVFFGSFLHYSSYVLQSLIDAEKIEVVGVVTTPPLIDKKGEHKNPVHLMAEINQIPVFTPEKLISKTLDEIRDSITRISNDTNVDYFVTAGYGKLLPVEWLETPKIASLNLHLSVLPDYRGANPGEWALLMGERKSGVTLIEMSRTFDTGNIIATSTVEINNSDTRETLYEKLYRHGGMILPTLLEKYNDYRITKATKLHEDQSNATESHLESVEATYLKPQSPATADSTLVLSTALVYLPPLEQQLSGYMYARRLNRDDGFISWAAVQGAMTNQPIAESDVPSLYIEIKDKTKSIIGYQFSIIEYIERATRALAGFPTLWTEIPTVKGLQRMKIVEVSIVNNCLLLEKVHIAGKQPARWNEVKNAIIN